MASSVTSRQSNRRPARSSSSRLDPADQLHGVEERSLFFAIAVQADDVRMPELFERLDLGLKADAKSFVGGQLGRQNLDGRGIARDGVDAFVNGAHPPLPQLFADAVGTQLLNLHDQPSRGMANEPRGMCQAYHQIVAARRRRLQLGCGEGMCRRAR